MPIYAYRCTDCGHEFDALQKVSDAPLTECPACQRSSLIKKVTAAGFQLKGSGWYVTDFRDKGSKKPAANSESTPPGEAAKTSSQTTDSGTKDSSTKDTAPGPSKPAAPPTPASTD